LDQNNSNSSLVASHSVSVAQSALSTLLQIIRQLQKSAVWEYAACECNKVTYNAKGKKVWPCRHCQQKYLITGGTVVIAAHLKRVHAIDIKFLQALCLDSYQQGIKEAFAKPNTPGYK
jgi:ribosomal protein L37AE/L43A